MTVVQPDPDTALTLLFGPGEKSLDTLTDTILAASAGGDLDQALKKLPPPTRDAAAREVTEATAELLSISPIEVLIYGWREYADLTSAARRTLKERGSTELVKLGSHQVSMSQRPSVAVLVDGRQVATLRLGLSLVFDVSPLLARIRAGLLVAILAGSCDVTATLTIDGIDVASKQAHLELPGEAALKKALRLLPDRDYLLSEAKAETAADTHLTGA
jgi:hypothetical protein